MYCIESLTCYQHHIACLHNRFLASKSIVIKRITAVTPLYNVLFQNYSISGLFDIGSEGIAGG